MPADQWYPQTAIATDPVAAQAGVVPTARGVKQPPAWRPEAFSRPQSFGVGGDPQTTVAVSGTQDIAGDWASGLQTVYQIARQLGFDDDAARVAAAIARTEGGLFGAVGDQGQSFGPYQFYTGGQLANYARDLGVSQHEAGQYAVSHPWHAVQWALNGYLGNAIRRGQQSGLSGPDLATYAQRTGQVSVSPERAGEWYTMLGANSFTGGGGTRFNMGGGKTQVLPPTGGSSGTRSQPSNRMVASTEQAAASTSRQALPAPTQEAIAPARYHFTYVDDGQEVLKVIRSDGGQEFHVLGKASAHPTGTVVDPGNLPMGAPLPSEVTSAMPMWEQRMRSPQSASGEIDQVADIGAGQNEAGREGVGRGEDESRHEWDDQPTPTPDEVQAAQTPGYGYTVPTAADVSNAYASAQAARQRAQNLAALQDVKETPSETLPPPSTLADPTSALNPTSVTQAYQARGRAVPGQVQAAASQQFADNQTPESRAASQPAASDLQTTNLYGEPITLPDPTTRTADPLEWNRTVGRAITAPLLPKSVAEAGVDTPLGKVTVGDVAASVVNPSTLAGAAVAGPAESLLSGGLEGIATQKALGAAGEVVAPVARAMLPAVADRATGAATARFAATLGGAAAGGLEAEAQTDPDDPNRYAKIVGGALAGGAGTYSTLQWGPEVLRSLKEVLAPVKDLPAPAQTAIVKLVNGENGAQQAEHLWNLRIEDTLGKPGKGANTRTAASLYEAGQHFSSNPTPEMQRLALDMEQLANQTGDEGRLMKYIGGDVRNRAFPGQRYFPHVYEDNWDKAVSQAKSKSLNPHNFYSNERTYDTLQDAIAAGKRPVDSVSQPFGHYMGAVLRSKARAEFLKDLKRLRRKVGVDVIRVGTGGAKNMPEGWVWGGHIIPNDPRFGRYWFEPQMAKVLGNITAKPTSGLSRGVFQVATDFKRSMLGLGTFHLITEEAQAFGAMGPIKGAQGFTQSLWNLWGPNFNRWQLDNIDLLQRAADAGLTLSFGGKAADVGGTGIQNRLAAAGVRGLVGGASGAGYGYSQAKQQGASDQDAIRSALVWAVGTGAATSTLGGAVERAVFDRAIPTLKAMTFAMYEGKYGPRAAASFANRTYGGNGLRAIGRSPTVQGILRGLILAPDWWEGWMRQVGNAFLRGSSGDLSRRYWGQMLGTAAFTLEGLNWAASGHPTTDNEPGHQLDLEVTGLYDKLGWSRRDPSTGQEMRVYWDVLGPLRPLAFAAIAGAEAAGGRYARGLENWLPASAKGSPTGELGQLISSRASPLLNTAYQGLQALHGNMTDFNGKPVVPPGTDPVHAAALEASTLLGSFEPVPAQQFDQEQRRYGKAAAGTAAFVGRTLSYTTPTTQEFQQRDQQIQKLGGDVQKLQQAAQDRALLRDESLSQIASLYTSGGVARGKTLTHKQIDEQEMKLRQQVPDLPELYTALSQAPLSQQLKDYLASSVAGAAGSDLPSDLRPDEKAQIAQMAADYRYPQPKEQFDTLNQTEQDKLRHTKLQDMAQALGVDPTTLQDAIKAQQWGAPMPDVGATSAEVESWTSQYLKAGEGAATAQERAFARDQVLKQIAASHPGITPDQVKQRINLRITPYSPNISEPQQSHERALSILLQSEGMPKYVDPNGQPMGGPQQWSEYDHQIKLGERKAGIRTVYSPDARKLKDARDRATAQKNSAIVNSQGYVDYERWYGVGKNMTEKEWQEYRAHPEQRWKDSPPADEARYRESVLADYTTLTPEQRATAKLNKPVVINGKPYALTVQQAYKHFTALQKPDWQKAYASALADQGVTPDETP